MKTFNAVESRPKSIQIGTPAFVLYQRYSSPGTTSSSLTYPRAMATVTALSSLKVLFVLFSIWRIVSGKTVVQSVGTYNYFGCYPDNLLAPLAPHALSPGVLVDDALTVKRCQAFAVANNYIYFGVENGEFPFLTTKISLIK